VRTSATARAWDDVTAVLDRLTVLASTYLSLRADSEMPEVVEVLQHVFELGFEESDVQRQTSDPWSWRLWLEVAARVEVIGALALRMRRWTWPHRDDGSPKSVPEVALEIAESLPHVADDIDGDAFRLRSSIGQFDLSVCFASIAKLQRADVDTLMIDSPRVAGREALVDLARQLLDQGPAREAIFPLDDTDLATALRTIENAWAGVYAAMYWYGPVGDFIKSHGGAGGES
jgi:hypothetical protein